jgi:hypothetical protein
MGKENLKMPFQVGNFKDAAALKREAIERARAKATAVTAEDAQMIKYISPAECADRTRIVFDDSGSMASQIDNAKKGVVEYLKNCIPNQSAVAIHFMNTQSWSTTLRSDLPQLAADVQEAQLSSGDTPFFNTALRAMREKPMLTRLILFTDGSPTDQLQAESDEPNAMQNSGWGFSNSSRWLSSADVLIAQSLAIGGAKHIPIDTVFFGDPQYAQREVELLRYLSDKTGGFFLAFDPAKMDFAKGFKYLAPTKRLALTSGEFRAKVEKGEVA